MIPFNLRALAGVIALFILAGCGTIEAGIERTPTPDHSATATVGSLQQTNAQLATQVATLASPTPTATPDLDKIAYVQGGDIYVRVLPAGQTRRLTTDGRNSKPAWSPSGDWLMFNKETEVWLMRADGSGAHKLPVAYDYVWSPRSDRLAYIQSSDIYIVEGDALEQTGPAGAGTAIYKSQAATDAESSTVKQLEWSPDGSQLAFVLQRGAPNGPLHYEGIWSLAAQANNTAQEVLTLAQPPTDDFILARWAPDGASVLFWRDPSFSASLAADGLLLYRVSTGIAKPDQLAEAMLPHSDWLSATSVNSQLVLTTGAGRETWTNKRLASVDLAANHVQYLTDSTTASFAPSLSPDGKQIAYVSAPDAGNASGDAAKTALMQRRIWVMNADGSNKRQLTNDAAYRDEYPLWLADGSALLWTRMNNQGAASLWLVPSAGGTPRQVVDELTPAPDAFGYFGYVDWSTLLALWNGTKP